VMYFEQVLAALAQLPEQRDTLEQAIDVRLDLYTALRPLGEEAQIFDHLHAAEVLADRLGDDRRLGRIIGWLGPSLSAIGEHDRAIAVCQRALALATTSGTFDDQAAAPTRLSQTYYTAGDFRQGLDVARRAIALFTGDPRSANFARMSAVASRCYVARRL